MERPYCSVQHIDLSEGRPPPLEGTGRHGAFVVFWWRDLPLGHRLIPATELPLHAPQSVRIALATILPALRDLFVQDPPASLALLTASRSIDADQLVAQLRELLEPFDRKWTDPPTQGTLDPGKICVIVPTCNRPELLVRCLRSVRALRERPDAVIVVDNRPSPALRDMLGRNFPDVRYIPEPRVGASVARNTAVRNSDASLLAFVDDDETVHPGWLGCLRRAMNDPGVGAVTGLVLPAELRTQAQYIFERRFSFVRGYRSRCFDLGDLRKLQRQGGPLWQLGGTGNLALRRKTFEQLGGFDERLGSELVGSLEDSDLLGRLLELGWRCRYEPRAVCYHFHRADRADLLRQVFAYGEAHSAVSLMQFFRTGDARHLKYLAWTLPRSTLRHMLASMRGRPEFGPGLLLQEVAGLVSGIRCFWRHRRTLGGAAG